MKTIVLHAATFTTFWAHYAVYEDPFFIDALAGLGYRLSLSNQLAVDAADYVLFSEATSVGLQRFGLSRKFKHVLKRMLGRESTQVDDIYGECRAKRLDNKMVLIVFEGIIGLPENHLPILAEMFPVVLTWNDAVVDGKRFRKYRFPQAAIWPTVRTVAFDAKKLLVNISANKYASHPLELYSARRAAIRHFERELGDQFDLYGMGWNAPATRGQRYLKAPVPMFRSYLGEVSSKAEIFPQYRFALCYENATVPGWVTEKIFDCMRSNCVPIYWGAPNVADYVDVTSFIDRRQFKSDADLAEYLRSISEREYANFQSAIQEYLNGKRFAQFLPAAFAKTIVDAFQR